MIFWFGALGAAIGSFLNVVIFRLPNGFKINLPSRSACMHCKRKLHVYENIPILSYIFLRGRCSGCGARIHPRYFLVEFLTLALFIAFFRFYGLSFITLYYCVFAAMLLAITFIDLDHRIIPDEISISGMIVGFLGSFWISDFGWKSSVLGLLLGGGLFWFMGWAYEKITAREGLGFGDVKLLAMIGAFVGPKGTLVTVILSSLVGSVVGLIVAVIQKKNLKMAIPYGPFLAIGALAYLFWGDYLMIRFYPFSI